MGKDKEMSKEELAKENEQLEEEVSRLKLGLEEVHDMMQLLEKTYGESKASFSLSRYGELKDMIKKVSSEENLKKVHSLTENQVDNKRGTLGLMQRARQFAAGHEAGAAKGKKEEPSPPPKRKGKLSGLFKKIKDATGFSDNPQDIRCLDKEEIRRDNERKRRDIQRLNRRGLLAYNCLEKLQRRYEASKKHAPPARYGELKDMIKDVIAEKL